MKYWQDYLDQANYLISRHLSELDEVELAKKLFLINNKDEEEEAPTSSPSEHN